MRIHIKYSLKKFNKFSIVLKPVKKSDVYGYIIDLFQNL